MSDENRDRAASDNRANQLNPNNPAYWSSRGLVRPDSQATPVAEETEVQPRKPR